MYKILQLLTSVVVVFLPSGIFPATIDPTCDFYQQMQPGQEYFIYNTEYPAKSRRSCRWIGESPQGTTIVLSCNEVDVPKSTNCQRDKLAFSPDGDENVQNAEIYCGNTTFTAYTYGRKFVMTLLPSATGQGAKFVCSAAVMRVAPSTCSCGFKSQMKIVGGTETGINEYPSMAGLVDVAKQDVFCGASIISTRYAVTACHCLLHQEPSNLGLLVGDHDISVGSDTNAATLIRIESFNKHPSYDVATQHNDIGVVKTVKNIEFNLAVNAICLPFVYREYNFLDETVTALGWGFQDLGGSKSNVLQKVDLAVISNQHCDAELVRETIDATQICTYADGKDACISDSGGPVIWHDGYSGKLELVGVISYGLGCATIKPAVQTRVTAYLSWIASVTPGNILLPGSRHVL